MSPDEPKYLPADAAAQPEPNVQPLPQPPSMYDGWDRGDARQDRATDLRLPPSNSLFRYLEVAYPWRPRFPASVLWAAAYFGAAFLVILFFLIFAHILPLILGMVIAVVWYASRDGNQQVLPGSPEKLMEMYAAPMMITAHIVAISLALILLRVVLGPEWTRRLGLRLPGWWHLCLTILLGPAVVLLANGVYLLARAVGLPDLVKMPEMAELFNKWPWWFAVLAIGIGPALAEELWCRGLIGLGLLGRNGVVARLLIASFYFGLMHLDPAQGTMAAVVGLVLFYVMVTTRSFWMPMLVHFFNNSFAVTASRVDAFRAFDQKPEEMSLLLYASAFVLFVTLAVSLYRTRARLVNTLGDSSAVWQPTYAGLEHPPAHSGVVVQRPRPDLIDLGLVALGVGSFVAALVWTVYFG